MNPSNVVADLFLVGEKSAEPSTTGAHAAALVPLVPYALKDAPALIESVFPAQKVSFEAQTERKAVQSQTLIGLGSYWRGRKPLILVRAIVLGCLLPKTDDAEKDLELFEALLGFDISGLSRRAIDQASIKPAEFAQAIDLTNPWDYFNYTIPASSILTDDDVQQWHFPLPMAAETGGLRLSWKRGLSDEAKAQIYALGLATLSTYEERSQLCKRPDEVDQDFLLAPVWRLLNARLGHLGVSAESIPELILQLGVLRFGHRPIVGDAFAGGGSIPFESAHIGCNTFASDLSPVACMLNWGNKEIIGATIDRRDELVNIQSRIADSIDEEITALGTEHDSLGNRAKAYLYCVEARCPETDWLVPLIPNLVVSKSRNVVAKLIPDHANKRFTINIKSGATQAEMKAAENGTVREDSMYYELDGRIHCTPIKTLRGDFRAANGDTGNRLRQWEKVEFQPREGDIFQERLYAIQWISESSLKSARQETIFLGVNAEDLERERLVADYVQRNLANWQTCGWVPDMRIEPGFNTSQPIRERGWTHWHHLFSARQLLFCALVSKYSAGRAESKIFLCKMIDWNSKLCRYGTGAARESIAQTFYNQAFNTFFNYGVRSFFFSEKYITEVPEVVKLHGESHNIENSSASAIKSKCDLWITDPPHADAVNYHEITEFFIAWLRKNPPAPFNQWNWDSRRALAIKGDGDNFRRGMIDAYKAMAEHMPANGMQCVMFTHQDVGVWSDMVGIFWAAGLQVVAAWYIATETTSELKKGGHVQGNAIKLAHFIDTPAEAVAHRSHRTSWDRIFRDAVCRG